MTTELTDQDKAMLVELLRGDNPHRPLPAVAAGATLQGHPG
jgi:hypothetical protein